MDLDEIPTSPQRPPNPVCGRCTQEAPPPYSFIDPADYESGAISRPSYSTSSQKMDYHEQDYARSAQRLAAGRTGGVFQMDSDFLGYRTWQYQHSGIVERIGSLPNHSHSPSIVSSNQAIDDRGIEDPLRTPKQNVVPSRQIPTHSNNNHNFEPANTSLNNHVDSIADFDGLQHPIKSTFQSRESVITAKDLFSKPAPKPMPELQKPNLKTHLSKFKLSKLIRRSKIIYQHPELG